MALTLAFDVYGTLIDTHGVVTMLEERLGKHARAFSQTWRDKQLEYSFRKGLMGRYEHFGICTAQALEYACLFYKVDLTAQDKEQLLELYRVLPCFEDVAVGLNRFKVQGHQLYAFSNGNADAVEGLLSQAGIRDYFTDVVSVNEIRTFKPNPETYTHLLKRADSEAASSWLISSNPFDVIGAKAMGLNAAWIKRSEEAIFDPWGIEPDITAESLTALGDLIEG